MLRSIILLVASGYSVALLLVPFKTKGKYKRQEKVSHPLPLPWPWLSLSPTPPWFAGRVQVNPRPFPPEILTLSRSLLICMYDKGFTYLSC